MRKNKLLKIFITVVLLLSLEVTSIAVTTGVVNADTVRVREKPSTEADSDIIGLVSIGKKVTIIGEEGNWYKIKGADDHGNKIEGYIRKDLLTVDGKTTEDKDNDDASNNSSTSEIPDDKTETSGNSEPTNNEGTTSGETTTPTGGTEEPNGEQNGNQPSVDTGATIKVNDTTISTIKASKVGRVGQQTQLSKETKIKILPSANSSNIATLSAETEVTILEVINSWCRIEAGENVGWVRIDQ